MGEETITINIDDSQLQMVDMQLSLIIEKTQKSIGRKKLDTMLPGINRELRLILGQLPGMRQVIQYYFRVKRLERGMLLGGTQLYLTLIATAIVLLRQYQIYLQQIKRETKRYELMVRRARGWTHEEFVKGTKEWENYLRGLPP